MGRYLNFFRFQYDSDSTIKFQYNSRFQFPIYSRSANVFVHLKMHVLIFVIWMLLISYFKRERNTNWYTCVLLYSYQCHEVSLSYNEWFLRYSYYETYECAKIIAIHITSCNFWTNERIKDIEMKNENEGLFFYINQVLHF
jgi:hypothetical protein